MTHRIGLGELEFTIEDDGSALLRHDRTVINLSPEQFRALRASLAPDDARPRSYSEEREEQDRMVLAAAAMVGLIVRGESGDVGAKAIGYSDQLIAALRKEDTR